MFPFPVPRVETAKHVMKLESVSGNCRLAPEEELQLLDSGHVILTLDSEKYCEQYFSALCFNRQQMLRKLLEENPSSTSNTADITEELEVIISKIASYDLIPC